MKRAFLASSATVLSLLLFVFGCRSSGDLTRPDTQRRFGVRMAKMNLWREAMFRFRREVEIQPEDAKAHNNLAVAAEANGDFDLAAKEYREALRLDRSNQYIQKNYSRFVEFSQKSRKRETSGTPAAASAAAGTATPAAPAAAAPPATATDAPPATVTDAPPATATDAPPPTATDVPPPTTTNPPSGGAA